jgi:hypothetical protein
MVKAIYCWKHITRRSIGQAGWMMLEKIYRSYKYQTGRLLLKIEEDGKLVEKTKTLHKEL